MSHIIKTKRCLSCKEIKIATEFYKASRNSDGLQPYCKPCARQASKLGMRKLRSMKDGLARSKEACRKYNHSKNGLEQSRKVYQKQKTKKRASACVRSRARNGLIPHASELKCAICDKSANDYHHPNGYDEANKFNVVPVCHQCHSNIHNQTKGCKFPLCEDLSQPLFGLVDCRLR